MTITQAIALATSAGDIIYCAPGVYRETVTIGSSGGNSYTTGTVSVTNGSTTVTGSGTTFSGNVFVNGVFRSHILASGADGVTNGTATFTSAAGNFQSSMIGLTIRITTKLAYIISAVASATSITLQNPDGSAPAPSAGSSLAYNVGPESPYDIASVDSNTQLTLAKPWSGPTLTGIAYECWRPIFIIGDVSGALTDGVGGIVRITGSDNDTSATRTNCITATSKNYITIQGISFDIASGALVTLTTCTNWIIQDCVLSHFTAGSGAIQFSGATQANCTIRRCLAMLGNVPCTQWTHSSAVDNCGHLVENCIFSTSSATNTIEIVRIGGALIRYCDLMHAASGCRVTTALTVGQGNTLNGCLLQSLSGNGLQGTAVSEITENYNNFSSVATARASVTAGANSTAVFNLFSQPSPLAGYRYPWQFGALSSYSSLAAKAGMNPPADDFFGLLRPATNAANSWGAIQFNPVVRATGTKDAGSASLSLPVAGRHQIIVNVTNVSTTISIKVYREANYAGSNPGFIVRQAGVADIVVTDAGSASAWNTITTTFTPAATSSYVIVELFSLNTATSSSFAVYFDTMLVTTALTTGGFEQWITDRIPLANYAGAAGSSSTVVSGTPFKGPFG